MRVILFRGKRIENGEWVEGYLTRRPSAIQYGAHYSPWFIDKPPRDPDDSSDFYNVDGATVGQYTGLTDKNGKKMFEGDIIAGAAHWLERMKNGVVAFKDGSFGLIWYRGNIEQFNAFTSMCNVEYEVIGNIYDNPELLEFVEDQKGGAE